MDEMWKRSPVEKYSWFSLDPNSARGISLLVALVVIALSIFLLIFYSYFSDDLAPDSLVGYICAIAGTLFILLAALGYTRRRRSHKRSIGRLNASLHWHISFGMIALTLLFLHSFGNFNPRSGTYALYSMIALVISGTIGRISGRLVPKLITHEVKYVLTEQKGEHPGVHSALQREEFYRVILSYWRIGHVGLALVTLGLTLWHLEYVATLLLPDFFHPGLLWLRFK
jgi:hypothetical protein